MTDFETAPIGTMRDNAHLKLQLEVSDNLHKAAAEERDELKAMVNELRGSLAEATGYVNDFTAYTWVNLLGKTPQQSLSAHDAEIRRAAIIEAAEYIADRRERNIILTVMGASASLHRLSAEPFALRQKAKQVGSE